MALSLYYQQSMLKQQPYPQPPHALQRRRAVPLPLPRRSPVRQSLQEPQFAPHKRLQRRQQNKPAPQPPMLKQKQAQAATQMQIPMHLSKLTV
jgi:hypothetical protein